MLNYIVIVGRLVETPIIETNKDDDQMCSIKLAVPRSYKNDEVVYETDFIDVELSNNIASKTAEYCSKGDLIGIKGRTESKTYETENGAKETRNVLVAEKVSFLANTKDKDDSQEQEIEM